MKEKERGKNETEKKSSEKKKVVKNKNKKIPRRESNPRPLNLQPPHSYRLRD